MVVITECTIRMNYDKTCEIYLPDWMEIIIEENDKQVQLINDDNFGYVPFVGTPAPVMNMLFELAKILNISQDAKYLAVHIYDKLVYKVFVKVNQEKSKSNVTRKSKHDTESRIKNDMKLFLVTCLFIANKVDTNESELSVTELVTLLNRLDPHKTYTRQSIITCEMKVFNILNWNLPTYTVLNCVELLLALSDLQSKTNIPNICHSILGVSYLRHDKLYTKLIQLAVKNYNCEIDDKYRLIMEANLMFLAAGVVLCSTYIAGYSRSESSRVASSLEGIVKIIAEEIKEFAEVLFELVTRESNDVNS